jgi:hypothetical protein
MGTTSMIDAKLSYFDFPFSREAFCSGRGPTSYVYEFGGSVFRHYGRNAHEYTLVGLRGQSGADVENNLRILLEHGTIKSVNFTGPVPEGLPTVKGPTEWRVPGEWSPGAGRSAKTRETIRRAGRGFKIRRADEADRARVDAVFRGWVEWAKTRHFMVFRGHYERWLSCWKPIFELPTSWTSARTSVFLYLIEDQDGAAVGIFGGEYAPSVAEAQITIAKHLPSLPAKALWSLGLGRVIADYDGVRLVHCGSTADKLKSDLGMTGVPSWVPDLKKIKEGIA